jgi:hypothetical protein
VKLVARPQLLFAVLATGFLAAALLLFVLGSGGGAVPYYRLPALAVHDVLLAAPCAEEKEEEDQVVERWWARPPARSAWHNMSDEELLWAASFEPRRRRGRGRPSAPGKVAFMFLTRGPLPLAPLWERFFNGTGGRGLFSVYVHTTPGYRLDFPPSSPFHRRQVPSKVRHLGSYLSPSKLASFLLVWMDDRRTAVRLGLESDGSGFRSAHVRRLECSGLNGT